MHYNTLWISDVHLGTDICQADKLLTFIHDNTFDKIYLNGDILDLIQMRKKVFWSTNHSTVIQKLLRMARKGTKIVYVVGNHDAYLESLMDEQFGNISIVERDIHTTAGGDQVLVLHGHQFDTAIRTMGWLYVLGDKAYSFSLFLSKWVNRIRRLFGRSNWSLSHFLKIKVKNAVKHISNFEKATADEAKHAGVKMICAGHIHSAEDIMIDDVRYLNSGCWTEYCSCVVEHESGELEVMWLSRP